MTALITVSNTDGIVGQCDAKCYDARAEFCDCICGGMNHGAGKEGATYNTTKYFSTEEGRDDFAHGHGIDPRTLQVAAQSDLFPYGNEPTTAEIKRNLRRAKRDARAA